MIETLRQIDHTLFNVINHGMIGPWLDWLCVTMRGKPFLGICYVVLAAKIYQRYPQHFLKIAVFGAVTFLLTDQVSSTLVKALVHRLRPCNNPEVHARLLLESCGAGFSFTSSHATNCFGMASFLVVITQHKVRNAFILSTWAALVSFSQVYVGVHFPADVIGGALLGMALGTATGFIFKRV